jgi:RNA polymerase sigma-70 factor (ECF subfamily)
MLVVDKDFIEKIKCKDPRYQKLLFETYSKMLLTTSRRYSPAHIDPMDNMHDAFIKIFEKIELYDPAKGDFGSWSRRIVINCALEKLNKKSYSHEKYPEVLSESIDDFNVFEKMKVDDLMKIINKLPDGYKQVFNMYEIEGYSHKEISDTLGIKEVSSRSNLFRAKKLLQELINNQNYNHQWMTA